jgi:hypothetical protein
MHVRYQAALRPEGADYTEGVSLMTNHSRKADKNALIFLFQRQGINQLESSCTWIQVGNDECTSGEKLAYAC